MSGRNHGPPIPMKGPPHIPLPPPVQEPTPFVRGRGPGPVPHPALLEEFREASYGMGSRQLPPHPAIIEEQLAAQHDEIQGLLLDNQRLAATHVALRQELEVAQFEIHRAHNYAGSFHAEKDIQMRELYEKSIKMEMDLPAVDAMRAELMRVRSDIKELTAARQELTTQVQAMTEDLTKMNADLQQVPALRAEADRLKQELQRLGAAIEYEKKGYAQNYKQGQMMEKHLLTMTRELEKLRAEMSNAEKRARAAAVVSNPGPGYNVNYGNPETSYAGNRYPPNYGMNLMNPVHPVRPAAEGYPQYGPGPGPGPGTWAPYNMQHAQRPR